MFEIQGKSYLVDDRPWIGAVSESHWLIYSTPIDNIFVLTLVAVHVPCEVLEVENLLMVKGKRWNSLPRRGSDLLIQINIATPLLSPLPASQRLSQRKTSWKPSFHYNCSFPIYLWADWHSHCIISGPVKGSMINACFVFTFKEDICKSEIWREECVCKRYHRFIPSLFAKRCAVQDCVVVQGFSFKASRSVLIYD